MAKTEPAKGTPVAPGMEKEMQSIPQIPRIEVGHEKTGVADNTEGSSPDEGYEDHKLTLIQACAANTMNMFGTGPFITIPFVIAEMSPAGPHAMLGYLMAGVICVCDSFTWAELGAMMPFSGGSYVYLRECFGSESLGRLMSFLFLFQFLFSGPLEVSSGFVAMAQYLSYIDGSTHWAHHAGLGTLFALISIVFLYNDIKDVGNFLEVLGIVTLLAIAFTIIAGFASIDPENYKAPDDAYDNKLVFVMGLFRAARIGVYDFTGYYDANQMGDEVQNPRHIIPRAGVTTACVVTVIFFLVYLAVIAVVPWDGPDGVVQAVEDGDSASTYIMATFAEHIGGRALGVIITLLVMVVIFGSCFAQLLGFSQIPYSAAKSGYFWSFMAHEHPTKKGVADYSLFAVGGVALIGCWAPLELLISAMVTSLVLCQFFLQAIGIVVYRKMHPEVFRPFEVPLYPIPVIISGIGFLLIWITSPSYFLYGNADEPLIEFSLVVVILGIIFYLVWAQGRGYWPFEPKFEDEDEEGEEKSWVDEHDVKYSPRPRVASADPTYNQNAVRHPEKLDVASAILAPGLVATSDVKRSPHMWLGGWKEAHLSPRMAPSPRPASPAASAAAPIASPEAVVSDNNDAAN